MLFFIGLMAEISEIFQLMLPIVLVIFLLFFIWLLIKLIKLISELSNTVLNVNQTIVSVDKSLDKLQKPLDTAAHIANTVDVAHNTTLNLAGKLVDFVKENYVLIKEFVEDIFKKEPEENSDLDQKEE